MPVDSTLPPQGTFHHAVLRHLAGKPEGDGREDVYEAVAESLNLSYEQRSERLENLPHLRYRHRTGWSLGVLSKRGYVQPSAGEIWRITDRGLDLLDRYPKGFGDKTVFQLFRESGAALEAAQEHDSENERTPQERIVEALDEIQRAVASELLERIGQAPPVFFEGVVLDLLHVRLRREPERRRTDRPLWRR